MVALSYFLSGANANGKHFLLAKELKIELEEKIWDASRVCDTPDWKQKGIQVCLFNSNPPVPLSTILPSPTFPYSIHISSLLIQPSFSPALLSFVWTFLPSILSPLLFLSIFLLSVFLSFSSVFLSSLPTTLFPSLAQSSTLKPLFYSYLSPWTPVHASQCQQLAHLHIGAFLS